MIKDLIQPFKERLKEEIAALNPRPSPHVFGIDLGEQSVKIVRAAREEGRLKMAEFQFAAVAPPADDHHITEALRQAIEKLEVKPKEAFLVIGGDDITVRNITVPPMPSSELRAAVLWEAKTKEGISLDDSCWDFLVAGERKEAGEEGKLDIIFASAPREKIDRGVNILKNLNLLPLGITVTPFCLEKLTTFLGDTGSEEAIGVVDIGYHHTNIIISQGWHIKFIRQMSTAGDSVTRAMTGALVSDHGRVELSMKDAEDIKRLYGLPDLDETGLIAGKIPPVQLAAMVKLVLERLSSEIKRSFDYYHDELNGEEVERLVLSGGGSKLKNFAEFLGRSLNIETRLLESFDPSFGAAVGLVLDQAKSVNLLPPKLKNIRGRILLRFTLRLLAVAVGASLLVSYLLLGARNNTLRVKIASQEKILVAAGELVSLRDNLSQHQEVVNSLELREKLIPEAMKAFSEFIPAGCIFHRISYQPDGIINISGQITGYEVTHHQAILAEYLTKLNQSGIFHNTRLISCREGTQTKAAGSDFELSAEILY